ncbi:transcription termination factor 1, mitochondrial [Pseudophryne corroboree]|uniref:transcription termination factor 1, mitochondrial n=1 Tax=Pseudophryne corroboree TaxID=495146 RepID=UPI003081D407
MALIIRIYTTAHCVTRLKGTCRRDVANLALTNMLRGRFYTQPAQLLSRKEKTSRENENLLRNLQLMGVDVSKTRNRESFILRRPITYERILQEFLQEKGASTHMVASIISRYPRAIGHNSEALCDLWNVWKSVLDTDSAVLNVVNRSPESFFRTVNIDNLKDNIRFFRFLGLSPKILSQLMAKAPRTFANSVQLNKQKVFFLQEVCTSLGGENCREFVQHIIEQNIFILTRSTKRIQANIVTIESLMKLDKKALLLWIQSDGAHLLSLSYTYFENNFKNAQEKLQALGFSEDEVTRYIFMSPKVLLMTPQNFAKKVNLLLECGIETREILNTPNVLAMGMDHIERKIKDLSKYGFDFKSSGLGILNLSTTKYMSKLEQLASSASLEKTDKK